jgi:MFS family permease
MYNLGAVIGQLPFALLFRKLPMNYLISSLDLLWGVFTLLQYRAEGYSELTAYRFLVGLFESAFFPGVHYVFGSCYRADEISRRDGVFFVGLTLGTLTASLIQAAASAHLSGVAGLAGWRYVFQRHKPAASKSTDSCRSDGCLSSMPSSPSPSAFWVSSFGQVRRIKPSLSSCPRRKFTLPRSD